MTGPFKKAPPKYGEDYLDGIAALTIRLESGQVATFKLKDEAEIPTDPLMRERAADRAHARFAFWAYQRERALSALRTAEIHHADLMGREYLIQRTFITEHTDVEIATEANIRSRVDSSSEVISSKTRVVEAQRRYGVLAAVAEAMQHRSHRLRKLVSRDNENA